jgi:2-iminobutanoate/2-iminopropanoate deaminase
MCHILFRSTCRVLFGLACAALVLPLHAASPQYFAHPASPGSPALPFSDAVLSGSTLYLAGHLGLDAKTGNAAADTATEAQLVMEAVKHTLENAGLSMDDLVSVTVFCTDLKQYETFNKVYSGYFHGHYPARAFIGASQLVRGAHFEVTGVAVRRAP